MPSYEALHAEFERRDAQVMGVSVDSAASHPFRIAPRMMVAAIIRFALFALAIHRTAKLAAEESRGVERFEFLFLAVVFQPLTDIDERGHHGIPRAKDACHPRS